MDRLLVEYQIETNEEAVQRATRNFAAALAATPQFVAFERAAVALKNDAQADQIISEYEHLKHSLSMMKMLGAVSPEDLANLDELTEAMHTNETISAYYQSEADLASLCQEVGGLLSQRIGINFSAACGKSCCS